MKEIIFNGLRAGWAIVSAVAVLLLCMLGMLGMGGCSPEKVYLEADYQTYQHVAPRHRNYILEDPNIDDAEKRRRLNILDLWRGRLERHYQDPGELAP